MRPVVNERVTLSSGVTNGCAAPRMASCRNNSVGVRDVSGPAEARNAVGTAPLNAPDAKHRRLGSGRRCRSSTAEQLSLDFALTYTKALQVCRQAT
jgi:hypothetical protein